MSNVSYKVDDIKLNRKECTALFGFVFKNRKKFDYIHDHDLEFSAQILVDDYIRAYRDNTLDMFYLQFNNVLKEAGYEE